MGGERSLSHLLLLLLVALYINGDQEPKVPIVSAGMLYIIHFLSFLPGRKDDDDYDETGRGKKTSRRAFASGFSYLTISSCLIFNNCKSPNFGNNFPPEKKRNKLGFLLLSSTYLFLFFLCM